MGQRGSSRKENRVPRAAPPRVVQRRQAALRAGTAGPLPPVRDLRGDLLLRAEICQLCLRAGAAEVGKRIGGWEARRTWCLKAQRDALLAWGFSFSGFPSMDTSAGRSFTFARRKEGKVAPLFSGFKTASPPRNRGAGGGLLWWRFSFMSLGVG